MRTLIRACAIVAGLACGLAPLSARAEQTATGAARNEEPQTGAVWKDRPTFLLGHGSRIEIHARLQSDYLVRNDADLDASDLGVEDRLSNARKRVGVEGVLFHRVEFQVEGEIGDPSPWRDVFADVRVTKGVRIRAGQFKVPFSAEQLTSPVDLDFISRAASVIDLAPSRDVGVMVHGRIARRALKYEAGLFETDAATRLWADNGVRTLAGRITVAPLRDGKSRGSDALELYGAVLRNDVPEGRTGLNGHLMTGDTFFHHMFVNGSRLRLAGGAAWNGRHVTARGEWLRTSETRIGQAIDGSDLSNLIASGGYLSAMWHVVPHKGRHRGDFPLRGLDVGARVDRLSFGSAAHTADAFLNPRADTVAPVGKDAVTLGASWFINRWAKVQANAVREQMKDPLELLSFGTTPFWSTVLRFQVAM